MKKLLGVTFAAMVLAGCQTITHQGSETTTEPEKPTQTQPPVTVPTTPPEQPPVTTVPTPPKVQSFNWNASLTPLINQMLRSPDVTAGSVLLVDNVQNQTNGSLQVANATTELKKALQQGNKFTLVPANQVTSAKQSLGLSAEDSLGSRRKAIGLARIVNAQYVLYSTVEGDVQSPKVAMQLMLVQTGEIIWSGNGVVTR
ncbi:penicillin-binding protein activator LpoB [Obesumbacterium proteus]|uniref:penicillin-binding protein activator LpoB n=1 Tax=Obesumbacterium proteus TaxID=82983 RepID=UPI001F2374A8|nr:penicillin-binding protein activator LpoB [Obesumbacterium proteus]MCE9882950.1 penicillin-binding protein activator LpoB [Obesumbacterium proteus]MCE9916480.1 penicillin-binding protein activator LpoB [Obesumbacterium proteus]MCE9929198.1 penicillin-binding protein activator LpoB [Obesumbacterium proteus]MCG2876973.1 penicillin-binding protein activator LpoB [Obesumbacterium proteus]